MLESDVSHNVVFNGLTFTVERSIEFDFYSNLIDLISTVTPDSEAGSKRNEVTQPPQFGFLPTSKV